MSAGDWEEVKRLAADFQRAQLSSGLQRLSERNCIEIINKLISNKQLEVVFTTDGKEYVTPQHLIKEIKDELYVHNGRINLVELAKILSVDLNVVSAKAGELEKSSGGISIINGQLIENSYLMSICDEINEKLKIKGKVTIAELTSQYDLPSDFLLKVVEHQLGKIIKAQQDKDDNRVFFTEEYMKRNISIVKGALLALTKPTIVSTILSLCNIEEKVFYSVMSILCENKEAPGSVTGKEGINCSYIPTVFLKSQFEWVNNFYTQNGYLEFGTLNHLGISNPVSFVKKHFVGNIIMLDSCAVSQFIIDQVEASIKNIISTASFVNVIPLLPSVIEKTDAEIIINQIIKKNSFQNLHVFNSSTVVTDQYLRNLTKIFSKEIERKAQECVSSGAYLKFVMSQERPLLKGGAPEDKYEGRVDKKEERRKKAAEGKGGGGAHGREAKTKSTKKKYMKVNSNDVDSDEDSGRTRKETNVQKLEVISLEDVKKILETDELLQEEDSEELIQEIGEYLLPKIHAAALDVAKNLYESTVSSKNKDRRKKHSEMEEKLNDLVLKIRLFEKGYKQFESKEIQQQLAKYLLKTICTDVVNEIFAYVAQDDGKFQQKEMTSELRAKVLNFVSNDMKDTLTTLNKSLGSSSLDDFLNIIDEAVGPGFCDILLKKFDKKKERPQLLEQKQQLLDQLSLANDPALVLHLTSLILFHEATQTMLHASGKFVSFILTFLKPMLSLDHFNSLQRYHDLVLKVLTTSDPIEKVDAEKALQDEMSVIKTIAVSFKKNSEKVSNVVQ